MFSLRSLLSATVTTSVLLATSATAAHADGRQLFTWSGTVDREAIIVMRGAVIEMQGDGFDAYRDARYRVRESLPRSAGSVRVMRSDGRGEVDVIEQPTPFTGFTSRGRVRDRAAGSDQYRLEAFWDEGRDSRSDDRYDSRDDDRRDGRRDDRHDSRDDDRRDGRRDDRDDSRDDDRRDDDRYESRDDDRGNRGRGNGNGRGRGNGRGNGKFNDRTDDDRGYGDRNDDDRGSGDRRDSGALRFSAVVDDVAEVRIQGRRVEFSTRSGRPLYGVRYNVRGAGLPQYAIPLDIRRLGGRGNVRIVQYPRALNAWTAVLRIDDSRSGADNYDIDLRW